MEIISIFHNTRRQSGIYTGMKTIQRKSDRQRKSESAAFFSINTFFFFLFLLISHQLFFFSRAIRPYRAIRPHIEKTAEGTRKRQNPRACARLSLPPLPLRSCLRICAENSVRRAAERVCVCARGGRQRDSRAPVTSSSKWAAVRAPEPPSYKEFFI